jgi:DivIVA domain-containing protein
LVLRRSDPAALDLLISNGGGRDVELTPRDIQDKQFHDAFRGYSHEEVDAFLDEVAVAFDKMYRSNQELDRRMGELEHSGAGGRAAEEMLRKTIYTAQESAAEVVEEARSTAERLVAEAETEAREKLSEAEAKARETVVVAEAKAHETVVAAEAQARDAEAKAREAVTAAETRAGDIVARAIATERELERRIGALRTFEDEYRARLTGFLESQLRVLSDMPVVEAPPDIAARVAPEPPDPDEKPDADTIVVTWEDHGSRGLVVTPAPASDDEAGRAEDTGGLRVVNGPARTRSSAPSASRPEPLGPPAPPNRRQDTRPPARGDGVDEEEHRSITRLFWGGDE